jgi:hypothetical protein
MKIVCIISSLLIGTSAFAQSWTYPSAGKASFSGTAGIGTSTPIASFQIMDQDDGGTPSSALPERGLLLSATNTGGSLYLGVDASANFYSWIQSRNRGSMSVYRLALNPMGGTVGVGTTAPITTFQIMDQDAGGPPGNLPDRGLLLSGNGTGGALHLGINATGTFYSWIQSRNRETSDLYSLTLNPLGGNVGIGTATPAEKMHIAGNLRIGDFDASTPEYFINLPDGRGGVNGGNGRNLVVVAGSSDNAATAIGGHLFLRPGVPTSPSNNFGNVYIADNGGKVAIGTGTPASTATLDVNGAVAVRGQTIFDATTTEIGIGDISSGDGYRDNLHFYTHDAKRMSIDGNGNVGIGTTTPDQKLTVKGIIHTNEVRVDLNSPIEQGPDYVFEPTYNLLPLSEVETYIKANKHLPEVPSAKEMEEEGLNLKEMNLLLLKKVEELTLHLIEMEKKNEMQQTTIEEHNKRIDEIAKKQR